MAHSPFPSLTPSVLLGSGRAFAPLRGGGDGRWKNNLFEGKILPGHVIFLKHLGGIEPSAYYLEGNCSTSELQMLLREAFCSCPLRNSPSLTPKPYPLPRSPHQGCGERGRGWCFFCGGGEGGKINSVGFEPTTPQLKVECSTN